MFLMDSCSAEFLKWRDSKLLSRAFCSKLIAPLNGGGGGVTYPSSRLQPSLRSLYCVVKAGTSWTLVTGGGFHLPVSASDFGA